MDWLLHEWQRSNKKADNSFLRHHRPAVRTQHGAALAAGVCVCPGGRGLRLGLFVYKREDSSLCPPAAVKTVLENQSEVSTEELTLKKKKKHPNKQTFPHKRPSGLKYRPLGQNPDGNENSCSLANFPSGISIY